MSPEALNPPAAAGPSATRRSRDRLVVGVVAGALAVATLAAGAGWMLRGAHDQPAAQAAAAVASPSRLDDRGPAPDDGPRPPNLADGKPAPIAAAPATAPRESPAPSPHAAAPVAPAPSPRATAACTHCGVVESVRTVQREGQANGVGAVAGGVLGAVVGNQIGGGNGRKAMTVLGAVGGGLAGHEVEKRVRSETWYEARVRTDDGTLRTVTQRQPVAAGSRVVVEDGRLRAPT